MRAGANVPEGRFPSPRSSMRGAAPLLAGLLFLGLVPAATRPADSPRTGSPAKVEPAAPTTVNVTTSRGDLDLRVYPPESPDEGKPPVLLLSGEGGWRHFDRTLASYLRAEGFWVGGFDCWAYFWKAQDDREVLARDVRSFADALARAAGRPPGSSFLLGGYSFGADLAPWIAGAGGWDRRVRGLVMIGPDRTGSLEVRITEILGLHPSSHIFSVAEALKSAAGVPVVFIHASMDGSSDAPVLAAAAPEPKKLILVEGGSHHFSGVESDLRAAIAEGLRWLIGSDR